MIKEETIKVINNSKNELPCYETENSAGMDLRANLLESIVIQPSERVVVGTGLHIELPIGIEAQVRSRSGLSIKNGIVVLNSPGTIDADYRGEVGVILSNLSKEEFKINNGDRIAQLVFSRYERLDWSLSNNLSNTTRENGGFGSTGIK